MTDEPSVLDGAAEPSTTDPLSEVTRRDRKALLAACTVGLAISAGGLVPQKIETFGITVSARQEDSLLFILAGVICYFSLALGVYARADLRHRDAVAAKHRARLKPVFENVSELSRRMRELLEGKSAEEIVDAINDSAFLEFDGLSDQVKLSEQVHRAGSIRIIVDVYFPLVAGATSTVVVWSSTSIFPGWPRVALGTLVASIIVGALFLYWRREEVVRWWVTKRRSIRNMQLKRLARKAKALPEDDPKRAELFEKSLDLIKKNTDDLRNGIY